MMTRLPKQSLQAALVLMLIGCSPNPGSAGMLGERAIGSYASSPGRAVSSLEFPMSSYHPACLGSRVRQAQCDALVGPSIDPTVSGITEPDILAAYGLSQTGGKNQKVAIVDAYDNPNAASDLAAYRSYFSLPPAKFAKYNQTGQTTNYPPADASWGLEEDLDIEMVSVSCPLCTIYLVEATTNNSTDLSAAEVEAVKLGATVVSNSYGGGGFVESAYDHKGITYVASAGDQGYGMVFPASYSSVVSVGGTELTSDTSKRGYSEVVWPHSGAGCASEKKPPWQKDPGCVTRMGNDVSAVAENVAEYDTYDRSGWFAIAGTSISSPLIAGIFGEAGNSTKQDGGKVFWTKKAQAHLYPVLVGSDGSCGGSYFCTAGTKQYGNYSGPGGWGSPDGDKAF
jgi:subtilase family serine protease